MSRILYITLLLTTQVLYNNLAPIGDTHWDAIYFIVQYSLLLFLCLSGYRELKTKKQRVIIGLLGIPFIVPLVAEICSLFIELSQYIEYINGVLFDGLFALVAIIVLIISLFYKNGR